MVLPVRPVNCGGTVGDGEFAGAPRKNEEEEADEKMEEEEGDEQRDKDDKDDNHDDGDCNEQKSLRFPSTTFSLAERYSFLVSIPTTIGSYSWLGKCLAARSIRDHVCRNFYFKVGTRI